jgi:tetratricopeptide (TPR) repeat protein
MGRPHEAEGRFRRALAVRRGRIEYLHGLALALRDQRRYALAVNALAAGEGQIRNAATGFAFYALRGYLNATLRRWPQASWDLERATGFRVHPVILDQLAQAYFAQGRFDSSAVVAEQSIRVDPGRPLPYELLAEALLRLASQAGTPALKKEQYARALVVASRLRSMLPADPAAADLVGRAALGAGRFDLAFESLTALLAAQPSSCSAMMNLSSVMLARRAWDDAEGLLTSAAECAPDLAEVRIALGYVFFHKGRFEQAEAAYRAAEAIRPSPAAAAGIAASIARRLGDSNRNSASSSTGANERRK